MNRPPLTLGAFVNWLALAAAVKLHRVSGSLFLSAQKGAELHI
jgi:hypothetical protein